MTSARKLNWNVVGRDLELSAAIEALGDGRPVVFVGPAGVGKTVLSRAALSATGRPRRDLFGSPGLQPISLGALLPAIGYTGAVGDALQAARAIIDNFGADGRVLLVDDAQWLDNSSAALLRMLVADFALPLCLTVRSGESMPPDITAIWKDHDAERIELEPFGRDTVRIVVEQALGGQVASSTVAELFDLSRGIPLHLRQLVESAVAKDSLAIVSGVWRLVGDFTPPATLTEVLRGRLESLASGQRDVAQLLACAESLGLAELIELAGDLSVQEALHDDLVFVADSERRRVVRLGHPLYGEVLRKDMPATTRRDTFRRLADSLGAHGVRRRGDQLRLVVMQREAGHVEEGAMLAALADIDVVRDIDLLRRLVREMPGSVRSHVQLGVVMAEAGYGAEAEATLRGALAIATGGSERRMAVMGLANYYVVREGRFDEAIELIDAFLAEPLDPEVRLDAEVAQVQVMCTGGRFADTLRHVDRLRAQQLSEGNIVRVGHVQGLLLPWCGRASEVAAVRDQTVAALDVVVKRGEWMPRPMGLFDEPLMFAQYELGQLRAADETAARIVDELQATDHEGATGSGLLIRGLVALQRGQFVVAERTFRDLEAVAVATGDPSSIEWAQGGRAMACAWRGDRAGAVAAAALVEAALPNQPMIRCDMTMRGRAWGAVADGRPSAAARILAAAADEAALFGLLAVEARCRHDLVRLGEARGQRARLAELAAMCAGPGPALYRDHSEASAARDATALLEIAEGFAVVEFVVLAALTAEESATVADAAGARRTAAAARRVADGLWAGTDRGPALAGSPIAATNVLTRRELEIARLAARGLSSKEIADQLFVSARTAENHLQRSYEKLGVRTRAELARLFED